MPRANYIPGKLFFKKLLILTLAVLGSLQALIRACSIYNYQQLRNITQIVWKIMHKEESLGIFDKKQSKTINSTSWTLWFYSFLYKVIKYWFGWNELFFFSWSQKMQFVTIIIGRVLQRKWLSKYNRLCIKKVKQQQQTKQENINIFVRPRFRTGNHWQHILIYYLSATDTTKRVGCSQVF